MALRAGCLAAAVLLGVGFAAAASAVAAERICEAPVSSGAALATTEADARSGAITSWRMKTMKQHGKSHADWGLAAEKITKCRTRDDGGFECVTTARPCVMSGAGGDTEI